MPFKHMVVKLSALFVAFLGVRVRTRNVRIPAPSNSLLASMDQPTDFCLLKIRPLRRAVRSLLLFTNYLSTIFAVPEDQENSFPAPLTLQHR